MDLILSFFFQTSKRLTVLELKMALRDMRQILVYTQVLDIYICVPLVSPAADFKKGSRLTTYMGLSFIEYTYIFLYR